LDLLASPLTLEAFAPFGDVVEAPEKPGRAYFETSLGTLRPAAQPRLWMLTKLPVPGLPIEIAAMERHEFSSQSFVPIVIGRWLIVVAPHAPAGGPDVGRAQAFIANERQGVSYRPNTWHSGLNVFDKPARLTVFMWLDGTSADEEIVPVPPFRVRDRACD
jgi:ureidoglycolate lyase